MNQNNTSPLEWELLNMVLKNTKQVSLIESFRGMSNLEKIERAHRVDHDLRHLSLRIFSVGGRKVSGDLRAKYEYYQCYKATNTSKFYNGAAIIRRSHQNYEEWRQYILMPYMGIPTSLKSLINDKEVIFSLVLLEAYNFISLEPNTDFMLGSINESGYYFEDVMPTTDIEGLLVIWDSLGRPKMCTLYGIDMVDEVYKAHFNISQTSLDGSSFKSDEAHPQSLDTRRTKHLVRETCRSLFYNYYTPIEPDFSTMSFKFNFEELIRRVSLSIAFDSPENDTLGAIYELFPNNPELLPLIIREYRLSAITLPISYLIYKNIRKVHCVAFGCNIKYEKRQDPRNTLYHSGALMQICRHPHLFLDWEKDSEMQFIYQEYVVPALRTKSLNYQISTKL